MLEWTGERNVLDLGDAGCYIATFDCYAEAYVERGSARHPATSGMVLHARVVDHTLRRPSCGGAFKELIVFLGLDVQTARKGKV